MPKEILIVDDEPGVAVAIQFLMEQQGHSVLVAQRGEDALDLIYKYKPDLVLLDIMLPGISGWEVCEIVRLNPDYRNVKIVFLTARSAEVEIAKGLALGADAIAIGTSALMAIGCQQYRICDTGKCPKGITTQDPELRARLNIEEAAMGLENYLKASTEELEDFARLTGNDDVQKLSIADLCTTNSEISEHVILFLNMCAMH